ncbi:MAG: tetratricopeptide repeat protein [Rickettsiales bacterium]|nr:tetratricopeptide repeat protein [Rickettsiales bacterium]
MTDLLKEIQSELKQEKFEKAIIQHGSKLVLIGVLAVVVTFFYSFYKKQSVISSMEAGTSFYRGFVSNKPEDYEKLFKKNNVGFSNLANLQLSGINLSKENNDAVKKDLLRIIENEKSEKAFVDLAKTNLAYIFIKENDTKNAEKLLSDLVNNSVFNNIAREMLASIFIKQGKIAEAKILLNNIIADEKALDSVKQRANVVLSIISK